MTVVARFTFLPEYADDFVETPGQTVVEMSFPDTQDFIEQCRMIEDYVEDVSALIDGKPITLSEFSK